MSKYSYSFKLKVVKEYLNGAGGYKTLARKYDIPDISEISKWVNSYKQAGLAGLKPVPGKTKYTGEFKYQVLQYKKEQRLSYQEVANCFKISPSSTIANWQRIYDEQGIAGLNRPIGRPKLVPKKKTTPLKELNESEREELQRLREENEFLRLSIEYQKKLEALVQKRESKIKKRPER